DQDLKAAMLAGDKMLTAVLRGLKSAILNAEIAENKRDSGLSDDEIIAILQKEAKKRQESADLYKQGGDPGKGDAELAEKVIIERYLPEQLSQEEIGAEVDNIINELAAGSIQDMGRVIGAAKQRLGAAA